MVHKCCLCDILRSIIISLTPRGRGPVLWRLVTLTWTRTRLTRLSSGHPCTGLPVTTVQVTVV